MNKVVFIKAHGRPIGTYKRIEAPTNSTRRNLLGLRRPIKRTVERWVHKGYSESEIDADRLVRDMQTAIEALNQDGFEVTSVTPVISGRAVAGKRPAAKKAQDHGFSYTEGMIIIARLDGAARHGGDASAAMPEPADEPDPDSDEQPSSN